MLQRTKSPERRKERLTMRWEPDRSAPALPYERPASFWLAVTRGCANRCPSCGEGRLFAGYLKVAPRCTVCGAEFGKLRADDAPPYFTIFLTGHLLVPLALWVEKSWTPPMWVHMTIWLPLFTLICILLLRPVKGATLGWMMKLGFTGAEGTH
jgi:uncharacterized protein (DUF983 family)